MSKENKWNAESSIEMFEWLKRHIPSAADCFLLWRFDDASKHVAERMAKDLPPHRRYHLIHARVDAERESALGLLAELISAEQRLALVMNHLISTPEVVASVQAQRDRIAELVAELQIDADPTESTDPKPGAQS